MYAKKRCIYLYLNDNLAKEVIATCCLQHITNFATHFLLPFENIYNFRGLLAKRTKRLSTFQVQIAYTHLD